jgi:hypothetical protein
VLATSTERISEHAASYPSSKSLELIEKPARGDLCAFIAEVESIRTQDDAVHLAHTDLRGTDPGFKVEQRLKRRARRVQNADSDIRPVCSNSASSREAGEHEEEVDTEPGPEDCRISRNAANA